MANHRSAIKRHKQSEVIRIRNKGVKSNIKTITKKVRVAVEAGNTEDASTHLKTAISALDRAVTKGVLHRNNASRKVSRLSVAVNSLTSK